MFHMLFLSRFLCSQESIHPNPVNKAKCNPTQPTSNSYSSLLYNANHQILIAHVEMHKSQAQAF